MGGHQFDTVFHFFFFLDLGTGVKFWVTSDTFPQLTFWSFFVRNVFLIHTKTSNESALLIVYS
jgi:hypothetical protein